MRKTVFLLSVLLLTASLATASEVLRQLKEVRTYISDDPARALTELERIGRPTPSPSLKGRGRRTGANRSPILQKGEAALYAVLYTQAWDKCLIPHTSDSLILTAVEYYSHRGRDKELRALSQFYLGSVCRDLGDDFRAVEAYLPAADGFRRLSDHVMERRASQNIADHLFNQHLFAESRAWYRRAYDCAVFTRDSLRMIMPLEGIAKCQMAAGEWDASYDNYVTLLALSRAIDNPIGTALAAEQLSILTRRRGNAADALSYASLAESLRTGDDKLFPYYLKGQAYNALGQSDSAFHYLNLCQQDNNHADLYLEASAASALASLDSLGGQFESAYDHMQHYASLKETIASSVDRVRMSDVLHRYEQSVELQQTSRRYTILLYWLLFILALVCFRYRWQRRRTRENNNNTLYFEEQLGACINQFMLSPWNDELSAIHLSRTRGFDAFPSERTAALQMELFRIFRPIVEELRRQNPAISDSELTCLLLSRLGFSTYTQTICTGVTDTTIRSYKHRLRAKLAEPYLSIFKI